MKTEVFDALHPFSLITDEHGGITAVGRSLKKLCPDLGSHLTVWDAFEVIQPRFISLTGSPKHLIGEVVVLKQHGEMDVRLQGQIVEIESQPPRFIFALRPQLIDMSGLTELGIDFSDFVIGDPLFDYLISSRAQQNAQAKLEKLNARLSWELKIIQMLHRITISTHHIESLTRVYEIAAREVCETFECQAVHGVLLGESAHIGSDGEQFWLEKDHETKHEGDHRHQVIPGLLQQVRETRRVSIATPHPCEPSDRETAHICLPITEDSQLLGVLYLVRYKPTCFETYQLDSFDFVSVQLGNVLARHRLLVAERLNLAKMAHASKMATLGEIAAGVAHEINNPLSTIGLIAQILKKVCENGPIPVDVATVQIGRLRQSVDRISQIVAELRAFSRDSSRDPFVDVSIRTIVEETLDLCHARFAKDKVDVCMNDIPSEWTAPCRPSQISQVILNLLNNAYDAVVGRNEAWIKIDVRSSDDAFEIAVTDSGEGVAPSVADRIMTPFFTTKPMGKGTGLGLSISSNIMIDHGGTLKLDRSCPRTRFVVTLPKMQNKSA